MRTFDTIRNACPKCGHPIDAASTTEPKQRKQPKFGDFSVCAQCACILRFAPDLSVVKATAADYDELDPDAYLWLLKVRRTVIQANRERKKP